MQLQINSSNDLGNIIAIACNSYFLNAQSNNNDLLNTIIEHLTSGNLNMVDSLVVDRSTKDVYYNSIVKVLENLQNNIKGQMANVQVEEGLGFSFENMRVFLLDMNGFSIYDSVAEQPSLHNFMRPGVNSLFNTPFSDINGKGGKRMITTSLDSNNNHNPENQLSRRNVRKIIDSYVKFQAMTNQNVGILANSDLFRQFSTSDLKKFLSNSFKRNYESETKWNGLLKSQETSFAFPVKSSEKGLVGILLFCIS